MQALKDFAKKYNLHAHFYDFRPYYRQATITSKKLGMYRQHYCGCEFSYKESIAQKQARDLKKAEKAKIQKDIQEQAQLRKLARIEYDKKQKRKRELLKQYKLNNKNLKSTKQD